MPVAPTLEILGAAGHVTGSRFLLRSGPHQLLVDCGLVQEEALLARNRDPFPFSPAAIEHVLLTHAHLDHSGLLPRLVHHGFHGAIWATAATRDIAQILLMDAARLNQEDSSYRKRQAGKRGARSVEPQPLYGVGDVRATMQRFTPTEYHRRVSLGPGIFATFQDAGHILGAASILVELPGPDGPVRVLFSGDLGRPNRPILHDPHAPPAADYVVVESTYGDRVHDTDNVEEQLAAIVNDTVTRGGNVVIPSFAVERTQEVLLHLRHLTETGRIPPLVTFLDRPMATAVTRLFRRHTALLDPELAGEFRGRRSPFEFPTLHITETPEASRAINEVRGSAIIIAGAGMCNGGRVVHHLVHNLGRSESTVAFVGYQAPGTLGRAILDGARTAYLFGQPHRVRARIAEVRALSAHADRDDLTRWVTQMPAPPRAVIVVHGEETAALTLRDHLHQQTGWEVVVPEYGAVIPLYPASATAARPSAKHV